VRWRVVARQKSLVIAARLSLLFGAAFCGVSGRGHGEMPYIQHSSFGAVIAILHFIQESKHDSRRGEFSQASPLLQNFRLQPLSAINRKIKKPGYLPGFSVWRTDMQSYMFFGGSQDGINIPLPDAPESIRPPVGVTEKGTYVRDTLSVGEASVIIYRHESLTPRQVLDLLVSHYKAWRVNRQGG
jgi:hypothetical protein